MESPSLRESQSGQDEGAPDQGAVARSLPGGHSLGAPSEGEERKDAQQDTSAAEAGRMNTPGKPSPLDGRDRATRAQRARELHAQDMRATLDQMIADGGFDEATTLAMQAGVERAERQAGIHHANCKCPACTEECADSNGAAHQ